MRYGFPFSVGDEVTLTGVVTEVSGNDVVLQFDRRTMVRTFRPGQIVRGKHHGQSRKGFLLLADGHHVDMESATICPCKLKLSSFTSRDFELVTA